MELNFAQFRWQICGELCFPPLLSSVCGRTSTTTQHNTAWWVGGSFQSERRQEDDGALSVRGTAVTVRSSVFLCVCVRPSPLQRDTGAAAAVEASQTGLCPSASNSLIPFKKSRKRKKRKTETVTIAIKTQISREYITIAREKRKKHENFCGEGERTRSSSFRDVAGRKRDKLLWFGS